FQLNNFCQLSPDSGPCKAWAPRLFYNSTSRQCELFIYGGCQGNRNRFEAEEECLQACVSDGESRTPSLPRPRRAGRVPGTGEHSVLCLLDICMCPTKPCLLASVLLQR
uniref:BPTI/Kunitz inhibitor domain-containing protein n=1 Tax=Pelusios castaneus TaxID=367368 RepID=A0A8C8S6V7_9SAUR